MIAGGASFGSEYEFSALVSFFSPNDTRSGAEPARRRVTARVPSPHPSFLPRQHGTSVLPVRPTLTRGHPPAGSRSRRVSASFADTRSCIVGGSLSFPLLQAGSSAHQPPNGHQGLLGRHSRRGPGGHPRLVLRPRRGRTRRGSGCQQRRQIRALKRPTSVHRARAHGEFGVPFRAHAPSPSRRGSQVPHSRGGGAVLDGP